jgi:hypothetical protein
MDDAKMMLACDASYLREAAAYYPSGSGTQRRFTAIADHIDAVLATVRSTPNNARPTEQWSGAWNNWIAPFHACPRCGASLDWKQLEDFVDRPIIRASCCGVNHGASLTWEPVRTPSERGPSDG